ncbi:transposase [Vibrio parahaemolyticus]
MSQYIKDKANDFKTVSVIKLPPYSPELNSIEQVWSGLRQRYLATNLLLITTASSPKSVMHGIVFWIAPKESPKYLREDGVSFPDWNNPLSFPACAEIKKPRYF